MMYNIVKLILICQIKDDYIPQLIPLIWFNSIFIIFVFLFILIINYYYRNIYNIGFDYFIINDKIKIKW